MSAARINGYLVALSNECNVAYRGADREPWRPLEDQYYANTLPSHLRSRFESMLRDESRGLWWPTCTDYDHADAFAKCARESGNNVELLGVFSPYLSRSPGRAGWAEERACWLGIDVVSVGEWSLLRGLLEASPPIRQEMLAVVNRAGLLADIERVKTIEERYRLLEAANLVEPIAATGSGVEIDAVSVYAISAAAGRKF